VFRRRTSPDETSASTRTGSVADPTDDGAATGKGRPTPTRREAEAARKARVRPVVDRRESMRRQRQQARAEREKARRAMATGDERHYVGRDRGPVRAFIRDWVDARRSVAEFFLPIVLLVLVLSFVSNPTVQLFSSALWMATMLLVVVDLTWFGFRLRREIRTRFPDDEGRGHVFYGITRSTQLRRLRLPKPRVRPGAQV
jgi:Protein of unknown function (DUF3043)